MRTARNYKVTIFPQSPEGLTRVEAEWFGDDGFRYGGVAVCKERSTDLLMQAIIFLDTQRDVWEAAEDKVLQ